MPLYLLLIGCSLAATASLFFSTLSYALRDFSRPRLEEQLNRFGKGRLFDQTADQAGDLIFVTAAARLHSNILVLIAVLWMFHNSTLHWVIQYILAILVTVAVTLLVSVAVPNAVAKYAGETLIAAFVTPLHALRVALLPATKLTHVLDDLIRRAAGVTDSPQPEKIEQDILSVVEEGEKEGVVDEKEREMIESVIEFRDTTAGQIMTARPAIIGIELPATLDQVKQIIEQSAHSRIPAYEETLDHIVGILYARDLIRYVGAGPVQFDLKSVLRPALYVPESKPLRDLLSDFRLQKVHLAIVLDEYGGTAGLVTIEDILEELVGDISDEHESSEPALLKPLSDHSWDADASVYIDEVNRTLGLTLPEDGGFETLGGFVSATAGHIPPTGESFEHNGVKYTILDAAPQKVNRIRIDLPAESVAASPGSDEPGRVASPTTTQKT
jgi:CBS domain containing-hemolysin-like protein